MRRWIMIAATIAVGLAGCSGSTVRSFEETQAQFVAQRPQLEALVAKIQRCGAFHAKIDRPCGGDMSRDEILADMKQLGLTNASSNDGTVVVLMNGDDGTALGVESRMVHYAAPVTESDDMLLTPPPHHWFYSQHD